MILYMPLFILSIASLDRIFKIVQSIVNNETTDSKLAYSDIYIVVAWIIYNILLVVHFSVTFVAFEDVTEHRTSFELSYTMQMGMCLVTGFISLMGCVVLSHGQDAGLEAVWQRVTMWYYVLFVLLFAIHFSIASFARRRLSTIIREDEWVHVHTIALNNENEIREAV